MRIRQAVEADVRQIAEIMVEDWQTACRGIVDDAYLDSLSVAERCRIKLRRYRDYALVSYLYRLEKS